VGSASVAISGMMIKRAMTKSWTNAEIILGITALPQDAFRADDSVRKVSISLATAAMLLSSLGWE
jgi:hypothetical protein